MPNRRMHLVGHICAGPTGHHSGSWRHPASDADLLLDPRRYEHLARVYEQGCFDGVFFVDYPSLTDTGPAKPSVAVQHGGQLAMLEPLQLLAIMARATTRLGLAATMSTSFNPPFSIARAFATLDQLSGGRAGWNIVTSASDAHAAIYGSDTLMEKAQRYDQADEVVEACLALWHAWAPDALKVDRGTGEYADAAKVAYVDYQGTRVHLRGTPATPRSRQDHPVLMQAGSSGRGREFAARWAEVIFTHQEAKPQMQAFYADMKERVRQAGRRPTECAILPSIGVAVGRTMDEAHAKAEDVDRFASMATGMQVLELALGTDLSSHSPDTPLDQIPAEKVIVTGMYDNLMSIRKNGRPLTLREAALLQASTWWSPRLVGTPQSIVDEMQDMFESECCDGFIIAQALSPGDVEDFVGLVVPELQRRGLFRTAYAGHTFRDHLQD